MGEKGFLLDVSSPRAVTGRPVAPSPVREPGRAGGNILAAGGHWPPDKSLTGRSRP